MFSQRSREEGKGKELGKPKFALLAEEKSSIT